MPLFMTNAFWAGRLFENYNEYSWKPGSLEAWKKRFGFSKTYNRCTENVHVGYLVRVRVLVILTAVEIAYSTRNPPVLYEYQPVQYQVPTKYSTNRYSYNQVCKTRYSTSKFAKTSFLVRNACFTP